jgi:HTH-type transcriptional regulator/antitoxin HigA
MVMGKVGAGYYIKELADELELTLEQLAERLEIGSELLHDIVDGRVSISEQTARKLSVLLGTSAEVWIRL